MAELGAAISFSLGLDSSRMFQKVEGGGRSCTEDLASSPGPQAGEISTQDPGRQAAGVCLCSLSPGPDEALSAWDGWEHPDLFL